MFALLDIVMYKVSSTIYLHYILVLLLGKEWYDSLPSDRMPGIFHSRIMENCGRQTPRVPAFAVTDVAAAFHESSAFSEMAGLPVAFSGLIETSQNASRKSLLLAKTL